MTQQTPRIGLLGANSEHGWASFTHLPVLAAMPDVDLVAVGTRNQESADATARRYGVPRAYSRAADLVNDPDVDVVVVSVRATGHVELIELALDAGKHVMCEWPLACNSADAQRLLTLARARGTRHVMAMGAVVAPAVEHVRDLVADGYIGDVESVTVQSAVVHRGARVGSWSLYTLDPANNAGVLGIQVGHLLSGVETMFGPVTSVSATMLNRHPVMTVIETGEQVANPEPDHVALTATIGETVMLTVDVHNGHPRQPFTEVRALGSDGVLTLRTRQYPAPHDWHVGMSNGDFHLYAARGDETELVELDVPGYTEIPEVAGPARNVGQLYLRLARDLASGTQTLPDFADAVRLHGIIDNVRSSAGAALVTASADALLGVR